MEGVSAHGGGVQEYRVQGCRDTEFAGVQGYRDHTGFRGTGFRGTEFEGFMQLEVRGRRPAVAPAPCWVVCGGRRC